MCRAALSLALLVLACTHSTAGSWDPRSSWDSRCEECHGDPDKFARKYLWDVDGKLQGRHHIDDLRLFMSNHYIPAHQLDRMSAMLRAQANKMARYGSECSGCHGAAEAFVRASISTWGDGLTGVETEIPVHEYLQTHQDLDAGDVEFFIRVIERVLSQIGRK